MTLFEEIRDGLQSGIDAYHNGDELRQTAVSNEDNESEEHQQTAQVNAQ